MGNIPSLTHATRHASNGNDPVSPGAIGAEIAGAAAAEAVIARAAEATKMDEVISGNTMAYTFVVTNGAAVPSGLPNNTVIVELGP